jgi:hypothetical protein
VLLCVPETYKNPEIKDYCFTGNPILPWEKLIPKGGTATAKVASLNVGLDQQK